MAERATNTGRSESLMHWLRNVNALSALAFYGVGVLVPAVAGPANVLAGIEAAQAGGLEIARRALHRRRKPERNKP